MRLINLFETSETAILRKISELKAQKQEIMKRAASGFQSGVAPQYKDQVDRINAALKAAYAELEHAKAKKAEGHAVDWESVAKAKFADRERREMDDEFSAAVSAGMEHWADLRRQYGGEGGLIHHIKQTAARLTQSGQKPLNVEELAKAYGVPVRSMYRYLERPEFTNIRALLPRGT